MIDFDYTRYTEHQLFYIFFNPNQLGVQLALSLDQNEAVKFAQDNWPTMPAYRIDSFYRVQILEQHIQPLTSYHRATDRHFTSGGNILDMVQYRAKRQLQNGTQ